jgi:GGDEF domain-containing protein
VALTRLESDEQSHRVIEAGGEGVAGLALRVVLPPAGDGIDTDFLRTLGARDWICTPLELSNGKIVGVVCAAGSEPASYRPEHEAQLAIAARILSYEWESVELRSELRRLRGRVNAGPGFDAETGLPSRESFLDLMGHEWRLAERGTVQSVLLACRVYGGGGDNGDGASHLRQALALKVAAEVLEGTIRETDRAGRVAESTLGAILIGCRPEDTPSFVARFLSALERVTGEGGDRVQVACGVQPLNGTSSPEEALGLAEAAASEAEPEQPIAEGTALE